jgi:RNA-binding protein
MDNKTRRRLRRIAHDLDPVVTVGEAGVSEPVIAETNRALSDHELIKVRIHGDDRDERQEMAVELALHCEAEIVQQIGKVIVLFRASPEPNPHLSNVLRHDLGRTGG